MAHQPSEDDDRLYIPRFVAFIDILGFQAHVMRASQPDGEVFRKNLIAALARVQTPAGSLAPPGWVTEQPNVDFRLHQFSDSLIISTAASEFGLFHVLYAATALSLRLLELGVLARGGIELGPTLHDGHIVFGLGVNAAYALESTIANVPRIVVGKSAVAFVRSLPKDRRDVIQPYLDRDHADGVWFVHFLNWIVDDDRQQTKVPRANKQRIKSFIQSEIDRRVDEPKIYSKIAWLARYWNDYLAITWDPARRSPNRIRLAGDDADIL